MDKEKPTNENKFDSWNELKKDLHFKNLQKKLFDFMNITPHNEGGILAKSEQRKDENTISKNTDFVKCLDDSFSTTRLCYKIDDKYLENEKIKENYKFKLNFPEFGIIDSKIPAKKDEKFTKESKAFDTYLFLPEVEDRKGEGGLRTKGYFKFSYKKVDNDWYIVNSNDEKIKKVQLPITNYQLSTTNYPLISIITVVFNGEKYLEDTILSVINQTYSNIEYIIIDGGSNDGTLDIIKKYEDKIDYWVSERDNGIYDAMNKGIKASKGSIISILNADDYFEEFTIEEVVKASKNKADIYYADMNLVEPDTKKIIETRLASDWKLYFAMSLNHPVTFVKKDVYNQFLFDLNYKLASDYDFLLKCKLNNKKFFYIPKILGNMRDGGVSSYNDKVALEENSIRKKELKTILYLITSFIKYIKIKINELR